MKKSFLQIAGILGALSVALGAFGAHALREVLDSQGLATFETGVRYQFYHVIALLISGMLYARFSNKWMRFAGNFFITGIILFSGSLYAMTALKASASAGFGWIGVITPFGGLAFILGWLCLFFAVSSNKSS